MLIAPRWSVNVDFYHHDARRLHLQPTAPRRARARAPGRGAPAPRRLRRAQDVRGARDSCAARGLVGRAPTRIVVFSASWITSPLYDMIAQKALNLHAGIAPAYSGSACNFWAEYDGRPELVGAQEQQLASTLDDGRVLAEVRSDLAITDPF